MFWKVYVRALAMPTGKLGWEQERMGNDGLGGGVMSTAGGLLFSGEGNAQFVAMDAKTGKILWHFNAGRHISAPPITHGSDGKEFVPLAAGGDVFSFGLVESSKAASKRTADCLTLRNLG
jgi:outer membrane protein assembly factor BamB